MKKQPPNEYLRIQELIAKNQRIAAECKAHDAEIEERKKRRDDTPGGMAIKILNDDVMMFKYGAAVEFFELIENRTEEESAILNELLAVAELIGTGDVIENAGNQIRETVKKAIELKIKKTGEDFKVDDSVYLNQVKIFAEVAKQEVTLQDAAAAVKKLSIKQSTELKQ